MGIGTAEGGWAFLHSVSWSLFELTNVCSDHCIAAFNIMLQHGPTHRKFVETVSTL